MHPAGADVIIDGNSGPGAALNLQAIAPLGTIIYMGSMAGAAPEVALPALITRGCNVTGFVVNFHEARNPLAGRAETEARLASGDWQIPITEVATLDGIAELHRRFEARQVLGRALVEIAKDPA
jgi:NADPH:quinone reductase